jgi:hypothetical protein
MAHVDLEIGVSEWRTRGLPPTTTKNMRWGAPYHVQFQILFIRCRSHEVHLFVSSMRTPHELHLLSSPHWRPKP